MAENNNVGQHTAPHTHTKLHLLCHRLLHDAKETGIVVDHLMDVYMATRCGKLKVSKEDCSKIAASAKSCRWRRWVVGAIAVVALSFVLNSYSEVFIKLKNDFISSKCIIRNNYFVMEATRPRTKCERVCSDMGGPIILSANISRDEFERWAYLSRPLVVRGAAAYWAALERFSVVFFRSVYDSIEGSYDAVTDDCQFLPFRTEFVDLRAALDMHPARAARLPGTPPWYFGWSNCSPGVSAILRQLAPRPEFLPLHSESSALDWIFMGSEGPGAAWHLDYVQRPSWQAQISGTKTWYFRPVPECQQVCHSFNVTVSKGDIIFVDTNQWYHMTYIHEGELSITIGSEYD
ncbi:uncharacterized protein [Cherax quadricarinatus]|nr:uncharacterized protein LOC128692084 isoform X1 [Cherax quadricarinatus]